VELARALHSIRRQSPPFEYELIVVDDFPGGHIDTTRVCAEYGTGYFRGPPRETDGEDRQYRNPGPARNFAYRVARGEVVICQSDDVLHETPDAIEKLVKLTTRDNFVIATVYNREVFGPPEQYELGGGGELYSGPDLPIPADMPSPLFFLGAVLRRHIYAIGGNEEDFDEPGYEDNFFSDCLIHGQKLTPLLTSEVVGIHQHHDRPRLVRRYKRMKAVYERKVAYAHATGRWVASGGPWPMDRRTV
jgi:glycosyltransferase involved in cell wall biosynthesis